MIQFTWEGRDDGDGPEYRRYHHIIDPSSDAVSAAVDFGLVGFAVQEGVRRNGGRLGAAEGPDHIRSALANMAPHHERSVFDTGNIMCSGKALEEAQQQLAATVERLLRSGSVPVVLGGGHEVAFGSFSGLLNFLKDSPTPPPRVGVINFDAHFDLRADSLPSSGTPFRQAAELAEQHGAPFAYTVLGIAEHSNTPALFDTARRLGVQWISDRDLQDTGVGLDAASERLADFLAAVDMVYVSIDLDVFPAAVAPGVSAPAARGVPLVVVERLLELVVASGKVALFDVAEFNPRHDVDGRTARVAALLIHEFIRRRP